jgi:hypothetical protein
MIKTDDCLVNFFPLKNLFKNHPKLILPNTFLFIMKRLLAVEEDILINPIGENASLGLFWKLVLRGLKGIF